MRFNPVLILGYPIDRISLDALETAISDIVKSYAADHKARFVTTLNGLFIGQLSGCNLNYKINPEVVETIRQAEIIGLDSEGLQFLAKLLGNEVVALIRGEDLLLAAASYLAKQQASMFIIGGREETTKKVTATLQEEFRGLKIAGFASPGIFTKGERIEESVEKDEIIIDSINQTNPTILILQLGHPKQEIWFERIKDRLKVPLCIGVGGAFDRYLQERGIQKTPKESSTWHKLRRRLIGSLHYTCWIPPLFLYNTLNRLVTDVRNKFSPPSPKLRYLFLSEKESLAVIPLPTLIENRAPPELLNWIEESLDHDNVVLDFSNVRHIDLSGLGLIFHILRQASAAQINLFILGLKSDICWLLMLNGAWDLVSPYLCQSPDEVLDRMSINLGIPLKLEREFVSIQQGNKQTILSFFGRLRGAHTSQQSLRQLGSILDTRQCTVDLTYCTSITNQGFGSLIQLREFSRQQQQKLVIKGRSRSLIAQFKNSRVNDLFKYS